MQIFKTILDDSSETASVECFAKTLSHCKKRGETYVVYNVVKNKQIAVNLNHFERTTYELWLILHLVGSSRWIEEVDCRDLFNTDHYNKNTERSSKRSLLRCRWGPNKCQKHRAYLSWFHRIRRRWSNKVIHQSPIRGFSQVVSMLSGNISWEILYVL